MTKYATVTEAALAWRAQPYEHFGVCSRCRFDQGETGHPLIVRRGSHTDWHCLSCWSRLHVKHAIQPKRAVIKGAS